MSPHSRIVPFSGDHHEKIARDEWMDGQRHRQKRQSTTVHDSSMEVSGSGSRRDRPTALDRPPRPTATTDRLDRPRPPRPPSTALDRPRPRRVEWTTDGLDRGRAVRDGRTDGRTERNGRTDGRTERTNGPNALSRAFVRACLRPRRARERARDLRFERRSFIRAFIHSFIHSSSGDERARAREG